MSYAPPERDKGVAAHFWTFIYPGSHTNTSGHSQRELTRLVADFLQKTRSRGRKRLLWVVVLFSVAYLCFSRIDQHFCFCLAIWILMKYVITLKFWSCVCGLSFSSLLPDLEIAKSDIGFFTGAIKGPQLTQRGQLYVQHPCIIPDWVRFTFKSWYRDYKCFKWFVFLAKKILPKGANQISAGASAPLTLPLDPPLGVR